MTESTQPIRDFAELRYDYVDRYLATISPPRDDLLMEMEARAHDEHIPIVHPETGALLFILARAVEARRILELGTAVGYSTIWLARALPQGGHLLTVEGDDRRAEEAHGYLSRAGVDHLAELRVGSAQDVVAGLQGAFDLIFVDIDKEAYTLILPDCVRLLRQRGLLVTDNTLFHGTVPRGDDTSAARALREYNHRIRDHAALTSVVLPASDGLTISLKE